MNILKKLLPKESDALFSFFYINFKIPETMTKEAALGKIKDLARVLKEKIYLHHSKLMETKS